jgi:DNA recombination protein RmuC
MYNVGRGKPLATRPRCDTEAELGAVEGELGQEVVVLAVFVAGIAAGLWLGMRFARGGKSPEAAAAEARCGELREQTSKAQARIDELQRQLTAAAGGERAAETRALEIEKKLGEQRDLLEQAKTQLADSFKALANDILEEKSRKFTEQNRASLAQLLEPLDLNLREFKTKVDEVYVGGVRERASLHEQVKQLAQLNQQLSEDANNLTRALKGSAKTQGTWGELILERVLEAAGLRKEQEYEVQTRFQNEEGKIGQPDVVIHLPENRNLVVDSKVSLNAYEDYANGEGEEGRAEALKRHLQSVRTHISGLAKRNYQSLYELPSLDFVVMFIPIEPAYALAVGNDNALWFEAWQKNVLLVGPSTLLFVVRTVANLWRQEQQNRNVQEIVNRGASLYDKLAAFVADLDSVGAKLRQAQQSYDDAYKKLSTGQGNLVRQAEMLIDLGVKPAKRLPQGLAERAGQLELDELPQKREASAAGAD